MRSTIISGMAARRKRFALLAVIAGMLVAAVMVLLPFLRTVAFLMDIAGSDGPIRRLLPATRFDVTTSALQVDTRHGAIAARLYRPASGASQTVVVFPGVHGGGVDEPRLTTFAGRLAATGMTVVTVPLPELRRFRITGRSTDMVEDAILRVARDPGLAPQHHVSVVGISFGGGLALVASGRPSVQDVIDGVVSLGGYGDLQRVLRYLCTGVAADGTKRPPHDYGLAVVALAAVPFIVPEEQRPLLEDGILTYLEGSLDESPELEQARLLLGRARALAATLPEPAHAYLQQIVDRDVVTLGRTLEPYVEQLASDASLSPERSAPVRAPVFLLHGRDDNIIPPAETPRLAAYLESHGNASVRWLQTPFLSHVGLDPRMDVIAAWKFVRFWQDTRRALN
jgi:acetyl esterase/lipase